MEEELLRLIYDYAKRRKSIVNLQFVNKLVEIVVRARSLDKYVTAVHPSTLGMTARNYAEDNVTYAVYSSQDRDIKVNLSGFHYICDVLEINGTLFEQDLFHNLFLSQMLLHELEHATHFKMVEDPNDISLKRKLIEACFDFKTALYKAIKKDNTNIDELENEIVAWYQEKYDEDYAIDTEERIAEIDSQVMLLRVMRPIRKLVPKLYELEKAFLTLHMMKGYLVTWESGVSPTETFLESIGHEDLWRSFSFYDSNPSNLLENVQKEYGLFERLEYGFPITEKEYSMLKRKID